MKTGGTALCRALVGLSQPWPVLTDLMVDHLACLPPALLDRAMLITGHLPYEAVELLPPGVALCTVVRDPVERTLSHHSHINASRSGSPVSIEEFVSTPQWRALWENYQARQLVHRIGLAGAWTRFSPVERVGGPGAEFPLQSIFDGTPVALETEELRAAALDRLQSVDFVGTTEDLDRLAVRIAEFWDRPPPPPVGRARVSGERVSRGALPPALLASIQDGTAVDATLYDHAHQLATPVG